MGFFKPEVLHLMNDINMFLFNELTGYEKSVGTNTLHKILKFLALCLSCFASFENEIYFVQYLVGKFV